MLLFLHFLGVIINIILFMYLCDKIYYKFVKPYKKTRKALKNEKKSNKLHA